MKLRYIAVVASLSWPSIFCTVASEAFRDAYKLTLTQNAEEILENPTKYFANFDTRSGQKCLDIAEEDQVKNVRISGQKCLDIKSKMSRSQETLHIYNKNKDKINNKINYLDNLSSNSIEKSAETVEPKIANSESVEKSHNGLAKEVSVSCNAVL